MKKVNEIDASESKEIWAALDETELPRDRILLISEQSDNKADAALAGYALGFYNGRKYEQGMEAAEYEQG